MFRKIGYKRTIPDTDWVSEIIIERFDASFELLSKCSVIYGGAVRDALAGMPLEGDLDISIPPNEFNTVVKAFSVSTRWKTVDKGAPKFKSPGKYGKRRMPIISSIVEFEGISGARAQLICSNDSESSPAESALYIPRNVDIICCGVVIDKDGIVYEVVEGAYDDCRRGILRLNEGMANPHIESLKERAAKLEKRGWVNKLNMKKAERLEHKKRPKSPRLKKKSKKTSKDTWQSEVIDYNGSMATLKAPEGGEIKWRETGKWYEEVLDGPTPGKVVAVDPSTVPDNNYIAGKMDAVVDEADDAPEREMSKAERSYLIGKEFKRKWSTEKVR